MYSLQLERGKFVRVRGKISAKEVEKTFKTPVDGEIFDGMIVEIKKVTGYYYAKAGEGYEDVASRYGCDLDALKKLNGNSPVYPTKRLWIP